MLTNFAVDRNDCTDVGHHRENGYVHSGISLLLKTWKFYHKPIDDFDSSAANPTINRIGRWTDPSLQLLLSQSLLCDLIPGADLPLIRAGNFPFGALRSSARMQGPEQSHLFPFDNIFQALKGGDPRTVNGAALKIKPTFTFIESLEVSCSKCGVNHKCNYI